MCVNLKKDKSARQLTCTAHNMYISMYVCICTGYKPRGVEKSWAIMRLKVVRRRYKSMEKTLTGRRSRFKRCYEGAWRDNSSPSHPCISSITCSSSQCLLHAIESSEHCSQDSCFLRTLSFKISQFSTKKHLCVVLKNIIVQLGSFKYVFMYVCMYVCISWA